MKQRWCTSDHKRGPIRKVMTRLVADLRASGDDNHRPVHLLNVMGFRAEESPRSPSPSALCRQSGGQ